MMQKATPPPVGGSIAFVQQSTALANFADTGAVTWPAPLTAGNSVIACISFEPSVGSIYLLQVGDEPLAQGVTVNSDAIYAEIWFLHNVTGGETFFQLLGNDYGRMNMNIQEWSGLANVAPEALNSNIGAASNAVNTNVAIPLSDINLGIAVGAWPTDNYYAGGPTNGFTRLTPAHEGSKASQEAAYRLQDLATPLSTGWALGVPVDWAAAIGVFTAA